jgi:PleD family two-component response regulator
LGIAAYAGGAVGGKDTVARILIVDDAKFMRLTLNNILKKSTA